MPKFKPLISDRALQRVYHRMLQARSFDEHLASLPAVREMRTGEQAEALLSSLLDDLASTDLLIARRMEPIAQLFRGRAINAILGDLLAKDARSSQALYAPSDSGVANFIGTPAEMATYAAGAARALQNEAAAKRSKQVVTMALLGPVQDVRILDSALRAAGQGHLPVIFVCRTYGKKNLQNVSSKTMHGVPHMPVDALDAVAVYRVAQEALLRCRTGLGSVLIEGRFLMGDPIQSMTEHLKRKGLWDEASIATTQQIFSASLEAAFAPLKRKPAKTVLSSRTKRTRSTRKG